jgi:pimeloyl-ACP methyl ester carboxylesterase
VVTGTGTDRGPRVGALVAAGYTVYGVNPLQAPGYRERHGVSGAKSDRGDAHMLTDGQQRPDLLAVCGVVQDQEQRPSRRALAPDETETSQGQQDKFPVTDVFAHVEIASGRAGMLPSGAACFAGDLPEEEQKVVWATHFAPAADLFLRNAPGVAWRTKPSWYIVASNDHTVHPELERSAAKRMSATTYELDSSHVPMLSQPHRVLDVIRTAATSI